MLQLLLRCAGLSFICCCRPNPVPSAPHAAAAGTATLATACSNAMNVARQRWMCRQHHHLTNTTAAACRLWRTRSWVWVHPRPFWWQL